MAGPTALLFLCVALFFVPVLAYEVQLFLQTDSAVHVTSVWHGGERKAMMMMKKATDDLMHFMDGYMQKNKAVYDYRRNNTVHIIKDTRNKLEWLTKSLLGDVRELRDLVKSSEHVPIRQKRSWLPLSGVFETIFGTAGADELHDLEGKVKDVTGKMTATLHSVRKFLGEEKKLLHDEQQEILKVEEQMSMMKNTLVKEEMHNEIVEELYILEKRCEMLYRSARERLDKLTAVITAATTKRTTPHILTLQHVDHLRKDLENSTQHKMQLATEDSVYALRTTEMKYRNSKSVIVTQLPFTRYDQFTCRFEEGRKLAECRDTHHTVLIDSGKLRDCMKTDICTERFCVTLTNANITCTSVTTSRFTVKVERNMPVNVRCPAYSQMHMLVADKLNSLTVGELCDIDDFNLKITRHVVVRDEMNNTETELRVDPIHDLGRVDVDNTIAGGLDGDLEALGTDVEEIEEAMDMDMADIDVDIAVLPKYLSWHQGGSVAGWVLIATLGLTLAYCYYRQRAMSAGLIRKLASLEQQLAEKQVAVTSDYVKKSHFDDVVNQLRADIDRLSVKGGARKPKTEQLSRSEVP